MNTIIYVVTGTLLSLTTTSMAAYAASRENMMFRKFFMRVIVLCMFFSGGMIPTYLVVRSLGLINTIGGMILPGMISMWLFTIMMTFFKSIPVELEDAAKIDGMGDIRIFINIALPLSKASLATIALFYAVNIWNDFMTPILYLTKSEKNPLIIYLRDMAIAGSALADSGIEENGIRISENGLKYALLIIAAVPIMCFYPFVQKYFVQGAMVGSLKG